MTSLVELGYGAGWTVVKALPRPVVWPVFRAAANRAAKKNGPGTQRLRRNLRQVVGPELSESQLDILVAGGLRSYARYWMEAFQLPRYSQPQVLEHFEMINGHRIAEAIDKGNGAIMVLSHSGNWDYAGAWVCANGWRLTTVAERLKPEGLYDKFVAYRESLGMEIVPATGGDRSPIEILVDRLNENGVVPLLADRDLSSRGVDVRFFGGHTRMPAGPALLALRAGAPIFVVTLWYDDQMRPWGRVDGPLAVPPPDSAPLDLRTKALTQNLADWLAWGISFHPQDWHMLQKLWLSETVDEPLPGESLEWTPSLPHAVPPAAAPLYGPSQA